MTAKCQFINGLGCSGDLAGEYIEDSTSVRCIAIDAIIGLESVSPAEIGKRLNGSWDRGSDNWWTVVTTQISGSGGLVYLMHDLRAVASAIAYLRDNPDRTVVYIDDRDEKDCESGQQRTDRNATTGTLAAYHVMLEALHSVDDSKVLECCCGEVPCCGTCNATLVKNAIAKAEGEQP